MFQRIAFRTSAGRAEVVERVRAVTVQAEGFLWNWRHLLTWDGRRPPEFAGQVNQDSLRLQYLSPFIGLSARPLVRGVITALDSGTELQLCLRATGIELVVLGLLVVTLGQALFENGPTPSIVVATALVGSTTALRWMIGVRRVREVFRRICSVPDGPTPANGWGVRQ
jgi:hypothetical protein